MIFSFKNIGIVESADIELKGLTVITGLNDMGKSFIGKSIYSIIKTLSEADNYLSRKRYTSATNALNAINSAHRQVVPFTQEKNQKFNPNIIIQKLINGFINKQIAPVDIVPDIRDYSNRVLEDLENVKNTRPDLVNQFINSIKSIKTYTDLLISILEDIPNDETKYKTYFDEQVIQRVFQSQVNSLSSEKPLDIKITDGVSNLLQINVENNFTKSFNLQNAFYIKDATIIDTPNIVQIFDFITNTLAFYPLVNRGDLTPYYQDLVQKWRVAPPGMNADFLDIYNKIKKIIEGELKIIDQGIGLAYVKDNGTPPIRPNNIATGIKAFGIIQLLINYGAINQNSLLIIDEPEVHLHPSWEILYAEIIVLLSRMKIPIIISTHSSYILESILVHSKLYETESITKFYFGEKDDKKRVSTFIPMTGNLDPIFKTLSTTMQHLFEKNW